MAQSGAILVHDSPAALVEAAAGLVVEVAGRAVAQRGRFTLALAGGGTPKPVYERLAGDDFAGRIDWSKTDLFFGDERCVEPNDPQSNYRMAREALLARVPLPEANIHRIRGEADPAVAAAEYEQILRETLRSERPRLDLVLLGIGDDGHTASLFPGTAAVREATRLVAAQYVDKLAAWRVSLAPPLLDAAAEVAFLVEGGGKAEVLAAILEGPYQPDVLPAQRIQPTAGRVRWLVDAAAAARLRRA